MTDAPPALARAWQPPGLPAATAWLADRILRRRAPLALPGEWELRLTLPAPAGALCGLDVSVGAAEVRLGLPPAVAAALGAEGADPTLSALLVEHLLAPQLAALEAVLAAPVRCLRLAPDCAPLADALVFGLAFRRGPEQHVGALAVPDALLRPLADALDRLPAADDAPSALLLPLGLRIAASRLALGTLARLAPGDALLPLHGPLPERRLVAVLGERLCWPAQLVAGQTAGQAAAQLAVRITGPVVPAHHAHQEWIMAEPAPPPVVTDAALDELEVTLAFEVGRVALTLAEIRALGPGRLLPLPAAGSPRVEVLAHGRRLGTGEIVRVGEELAVRLLAWQGS